MLLLKVWQPGLVHLSATQKGRSQRAVCADHGLAQAPAISSRKGHWCQAMAQHRTERQVTLMSVYNSRRRYERAEKTLGNYEADIFRHLDAGEDVMAEASSKGVKCGTLEPTLFLSRTVSTPC